MPVTFPNWNGPIITFVRKFLGRGDNGIPPPIKPKWIDVVDPNDITGNPPNLNTDRITVDENSLPFHISIIKASHVRLKTFVNNQLVADELFILEDRLINPVTVDVTERSTQSKRETKTRELFILESIP